LSNRPKLKRQMLLPSVGGNRLATSINERRASAKTSGLLGTRIS
jgi:hypothetical protein